MKRTVSILAAILLMLALSAESSCGSPSSESSAKPPAVAPPPAKGNNGGDPKKQNPDPVQGDPSAHSTREGELDIHVEWVSENKLTPACEWSLNSPGVGNPCNNMESGEQDEPGDDYVGLWEHGIMAKPGDIIWLSAQANRGYKSIECSYWWKGSYHSFPTTGKRCGGQAKLN